ncbi:hypothetical protein HK102_000582 [Quaeritorhiza haematococci]|nr:hypothetical protein HK102_000582 [Quaeritorhiza haematococci]
MRRLHLLDKHHVPKSYNFDVILGTLIGEDGWEATRKKENEDKQGGGKERQRHGARKKNVGKVEGNGEAMTTGAVPAASNEGTGVDGANVERISPDISSPELPMDIENQSSQQQKKNKKKKRRRRNQGKKMSGLERNGVDEAMPVVHEKDADGSGSSDEEDAMDAEETHAVADKSDNILQRVTDTPPITPPSINPPTDTNTAISKNNTVPTTVVKAEPEDMDLEALSRKMSSLKLLPRQLQFGRGTKMFSSPRGVSGGGKKKLGEEGALGIKPNNETTKITAEVADGGHTSIAPMSTEQARPAGKGKAKARGRAEGLKQDNSHCAWSFQKARYVHRSRIPQTQWKQQKQDAERHRVKKEEGKMEGVVVMESEGVVDTRSE